MTNRGTERDIGHDYKIDIDVSFEESKENVFQLVGIVLTN